MCGKVISTKSVKKLMELHAFRGVIYVEMILAFGLGDELDS